MRGDDVGYKVKAAQEAPNGNLVDDILNGRFEQHQNEAEDLLGSGIEEFDDDFVDLCDGTGESVGVELSLMCGFSILSTSFQEKLNDFLFGKDFTV